MKRTAAVALTVGMSTAVMSGQSIPPPTQGPLATTFDAASVKPNNSGDPVGAFNPRPGRFTTQNLPLRALITYAYQVRTFQIEGGQDWIDRDRFDIVASMRADSFGNVNVMVQRLLEDRFSLRIRRETRQAPIYALVKARADGALGPGLVPVKIDCFDETVRKTTPCRQQNGPTMIQATGLQWTGRNMAAQLMGTVNRLIVDRTGLSGQFNVSLRWTPDLPVGIEPGTGGDRVSLFTALQEQLGLRLEPTTGPVEMLVIESVSRPTPD